MSVWGPNRVGIKLTPAVGRGDLGMWPVERQIEQFTYLIKELDKRPLAYINLVRYLGEYCRRDVFPLAVFEENKAPPLFQTFYRLTPRIS